MFDGSLINRYIEKYFKCTKDATMEICGTIAAEYHDKILRLSVDPLIEDIRCGEYSGGFSISQTDERCYQEGLPHPPKSISTNGA